MSSWLEGDVDSDGINIHYYRTGQGDKPPLILAHGFTDNGLCWYRTAKALEGDYDLVMVDARNHGQSDSGSAHQLELAADFAAVITKLELGSVAALGHSVGGNVVTALAAEYPKLVSTLMVEDPPWTIPHKTPSKNSARFKAFRDHVESLAQQTQEQIELAGRQQHPRWHAQEFPPWAASNLQVQAQAMEQLVLQDWAELVPKICCPSLLIYGDTEKGGIVGEHTAAAVQALNPLVQTRHVPGAGHNLRREAFEAYVALVAAHLEAH